MDGVTLNGIHCSTWGLILSTVSIEKPTPKTSYIDIPFGDGSIDISEAAGEVKYQDRKITMSLQKFVESKAELETLSAEIAGKLQGKKVKINFDSDPDYYYYGRPIITSYQKTNPLAEIIIEALCEPYKYKNDITEKSYNCAYNLLMNGNMASTDGWTANGMGVDGGTTITASSNVLEVITSTSITQLRVQHALTKSIISGHQYYVNAQVKSGYSGTLRVLVGTYEFLKASAASNTWYDVGGIFTATTNETINAIVGQNYAYSGVSQTMNIKNVICIDLTKLYGAGNEPTKSEFETILADFTNSWFDVAVLGEAVSDIRKTLYPPLSTAINLVKNGNFADTENWTAEYPAQASLSAADNVMSITIVDDAYANNAILQSGKSALIAGHKYYIAAKIRVTNSVCTSMFVSTKGGSPASITSPTADQWYTIAEIITETSSSLTYDYKIGHQYATGAAASGKVMQIKYVMSVDLTELYGAGCEPTATEFANILADFDDSWFDVANVPGWELPVTLTNGRKTAYLVVTTNAPFSIVKGENTYSFGSVTGLQSVIPLTEGENTLNLNGNGILTLDWQEGAL